jgi:hypothetical protein
MTPNALRSKVIAEWYIFTRKSQTGNCTKSVESLLNALLRWINDHPEKIDHSL